MKRRELSDDIMEAEDISPQNVADLLQKFRHGEMWEMSFRVEIAPSSIERYIERLREAGLDIGKGDAEFGYKMPLPEKEKSYRYLQIFRRS